MHFFMTVYTHSVMERLLLTKRERLGGEIGVCILCEIDPLLSYHRAKFYNNISAMQS